MDEDQILQSIIADPNITDPSIDVSNLRTTTPTRSELLAAVPEFSGLKFDPTQRSYIEDLYSVYSGGLPTLATDTAQIPGAVDTLVDVGGGGEQTLPGFDVDSPKNTDFEQNLIDQGIGVQGTIGDPVVAPGEMPVTQEEMDAFNQIPVTQPITGGITGDPIDVGIPDNESGFVDPLGTIGGAPVVGDFSEPTTGTISDDRLNEVIGGQPMAAGPFDYLQEQTPISQVQVDGGLSATDAERLANYTTPEQQNLISQAFSKVGSTANDIMRDLSEIPGAVANFVDKTVDIAGQKINVGGTLLRAGINKIVGGPISLVFDGIGALASNLPPGISETTNKAREVGLLQGDGTVTQDKYGINTQSMFGDYNQYNIDRVDQLEDKVNKTPRDIQELKERKDYIDSTGATGDITPDATPTDIATGNITGDGAVAEAAEQKAKNEAFADIQNQIGQSLHGEGGSNPASAPAAPTNVGNPFGYGGGGGQDSGGGNGGGSSSGGGGESGYGGFCFDPNTPIQMANGSTKKIKNIQLGDDTKGGEVTGVFQFKATDEIHDYKGVTVAGSHYVKEDGKFIMVQDSPISVKIDKIPVVYSLDTTGRRIFIKDIEFADYNGDGIAKGFLANAGVDTKGFDKEVLRQVENRLI